MASNFTCRAVKCFADRLYIPAVDTCPPQPHLHVDIVTGVIGHQPGPRGEAHEEHQRRHRQGQQAAQRPPTAAHRRRLMHLGGWLMLCDYLMSRMRQWDLFWRFLMRESSVTWLHSVMWLTESGFRWEVLSFNNYSTVQCCLEPENTKKDSIKELYIVYLLWPRWFLQTSSKPCRSSTHAIISAQWWEMALTLLDKAV